MAPRQIASMLERVCRFGVGLAFAVLIVAVLIQVAGRLLGDSPVWTEELTRYALLHMAGWGAGLAYHTGVLVNVDLLCERLPACWPHRLRILSAATTALLCAVLLVPAWKYASIGALQTSPALAWRMDLIHVSILILLVSLMSFALLRVWTLLASGKRSVQPSQ